MIAIVGAGISGLTLAYELQKRNLPYQLFESASEPGGVMRSRREGPYLLEQGPNSLLGDSLLLDWINNLGLTPELTFANPVSKARFVFQHGAYRQLPAGPLSLLLGSFFSWHTKKAIWREWANRSTSPPSETLSAFFRRRFSQEIVDYVVGPFVAGTYAGDPDRLLVSETFPFLLEYEKQYGSVLLGLIKNASATSRRQSFTFRDGMQTLPKVLAARLNNLSLNDPVYRLVRTGSDWRLDTETGSYTATIVVLATDSETTANLLKPIHPTISAELCRIDYPPVAIVHTVYKRAEVCHPLNGFGGLNPRREQQFAAGHIWTSSVFKDRCPTDEVLFTTFVGGRQAAENAELPDDVLRQRVHAELVRAFTIRALAPTHQWVTRWTKAIPQYDIVIPEIKQQLPLLELDSLFVCSNWYGGVSLSDCIRKAQELARRLAEFERID